MKKSDSISSKFNIFHPKFALLISIIVTLLYIIFASLKFSGDKLFNQYYYVAPIIIPFIIFLIDRADNFQRSTKLINLTDAVVIITAIWRVIGDVPYVSGHSLFLTYAILSSYSIIGRFTAVIVIIEVIYLKVFIWNDWLTLLNGMILGLAAFLLMRKRKAADMIRNN